MLAISFKLTQGEKKRQTGINPSAESGVVSIH